MIARGRYWQASLTRKREGVQLAIAELPQELEELRSVELEVPLARWNAVVKHAESDRKLLGGILHDLASPKESESIARVVGTDRLLADLQRTLRDATVALIEAGLLRIVPATEGEAE
jgi:hypothetical protein